MSDDSGAPVPEQLTEGEAVRRLIGIYREEPEILFPALDASKQERPFLLAQLAGQKGLSWEIIG